MKAKRARPGEVGKGRSRKVRSKDRKGIQIMAQKGKVKLGTASQGEPRQAKKSEE